MIEDLEMILIRVNHEKEAAPKGKRTVRETTWGNTNAYIGRKFWRTIGPTYKVGVKEEVEAFLKGEID